MLTTSNPYIAGPPVGDTSAFFGREDILEQVLEELEDERNRGVLLYGQRRVGKTSILHHLVTWLPRRGNFHAVYFDLEDKATWPLGRILEHLAATIAESLGMPMPSEQVEPEKWFRTSFLPLTFDRIAVQSRLVVLFDEFDVLADVRTQNHAADVFRYLRELMSREWPRLRFIFVIGRNLDDLETIAKSLFKGVPAKRVSLLAREDADKLIRLSEAHGGIMWEDEAAHEAWELSHGHAFLLQYLCRNVWQRVRGSATARKVTVNDVNAAVPATLDKSRPALEWFWNGLPPAERFVAAALAAAGRRPISQDALQDFLHENGVRVIIRKLNDAPRLLQEWDLIEPVTEGYQFRVELLRQWVATFKPLSRVQQELDAILPAADGLFQAAQGFQRNGDLTKARAKAEEALKENPNHLGATELLLDLLLQSGDLAEARRHLEQLYENHPAIARPRLAQVLLKQAEAADDEDAKLDLYEYILKMGRNPDAQAGRQRIWRERAERAKTAERREDAAQAYRKAGLDTEAKEIEDQIRRHRLKEGLDEVENLRRVRRYASALERTRALAAEFADHRDWESDIVDLEHWEAVEQRYQRALGALQDKDRRAAMQNLSQVIAADPEYKDAARALYEAVSGIEVASLEVALAELHLARTRETKRKHRTRIGIGVVAFIVTVVGGAEFFAYLRHPSAIRLDPARVDIYEAGKAVHVDATLVMRSGSRKADTVRWVSGNTNIITIDAEGNVTGVGAGETHLTAYSAGLLAEIPVQVNLPSKMVLSPSTIVLTPDKQGKSEATIRATIIGTGDQPWPGSPTVAWKSRDPKIVAVSSGAVRCLATGGSAVVEASFGALTGTTTVGCPPETICDDGKDNDGDGRTDCDDPDCVESTGCKPIGACPEGTKRYAFISTDVPRFTSYYEDVNSTIRVDRGGTVGKFGIYNLTLEDPNPLDLRISLTLPSGRNLTLVSYASTPGKPREPVFDRSGFGDDCTIEIKESEAPRRACMRPAQPFRTAKGERSDGKWLINISASLPAHGNGKLSSWGLLLCIAE